MTVVTVYVRYVLTVLVFSISLLAVMYVIWSFSFSKP